jgi:putative PIN family toxin of toxin-antitoxin system
MRRPRIVLDTNVLISALLFGGAPREVLEMVIVGLVDCVLSLPILDELRDVLQRPKFGFSPQQAAGIVEELSALSEIINPPAKLRVINVDPDDNRVLECAVEARASVIVSGDAHLLELVEYEDIRILSPSEFLRTIAPQIIKRRRRRRR